MIAVRSDLEAAKIIQDILSRLDAKTLMRLRCVCKAWSNLISSPRFQQLHSSRSHHHLLLLFRSNNPFYNPLDHPEQHFSYPFASTDITGKIFAKFAVKVDDPIKLVLPSCCGLVCFATDTCIYVCNPATREILALPVCPQRTSIAGFGFAYVDTIMGYKVVRLINRISRSFMTLTIECSVATIPSAAGSDSWRLLDEGCPYMVEQFSYPVFARDNIYWKINLKGHRQLRRSNDYIVSFNIKEERFSTVTHPADWRSVAHNTTQLANLGGMLCMAMITTSNAVIWVLKDHHNCFWHKRGFIEFQGIDRRVIGEIRLFKNGELIFSSPANILLFYDIKKKRFRQVQLPFRALEFGTYWESLFSLGVAR